MKSNETIPRAQKQRAQTVDKAMLVLNAVADSDDPLSLTALVGKTGLEKTTTHRLARSLADGGVLRFDSDSRTYSLGWRLIELGALASRRTSVLLVATPHLIKLRDKTGETVHLGAYNDGAVVYLAQESSDAAVIIRARVGQRRPLHATAMGKVLLAFGPESWLAELLQRGELEVFTDNTISEEGTLRRELRRIRELGYAIDDEEMSSGIRCVAAPVMDSAGRSVAAISVTFPAYRVSLNDLEHLSTDVCAVARAVSTDLVS